MIQLDTSELQRWGGLLQSEVAAIAVRIQPAVDQQTRETVTRAKAAAPILTGALQASIRPFGKGLRRRVRAGGGKAFYGRFQEFGTRKMRAHPFLIPQVNPSALTEFEARVVRAYRDGPMT